MVAQPMPTCPRRPGPWLALALLLAAGAEATAEELRGRITLLNGMRPCKSCDVSEAVVYYEPRGGRLPASTGGTFEMLTWKKRFQPRVLAVPKGSSVRFPSRDPILHNVFSVSKGNAFDLGLYREGTVKETAFHSPGVVRIFCNVHASMVAYVLVLETPFVAAPDARGEFVLSGLPAGEGRLTVWHDRAEPHSLDLALPAKAPLDLEIEASKPQIPAHLNKFGKPYPGRGRDDYGQ